MKFVYIYLINSEVVYEWIILDESLSLWTEMNLIKESYSRIVFDSVCTVKIKLNLSSVIMINHD